MKRSKIQPDHHCCSIEKKQLMKELKACDETFAGHEAHHQCYREAARRSGRRGKACMYS
ncbi:MAG: hypothetical protein ACOZF0_21980 [Thermodesulfobacteriota bacterium]